MAVTTDSPAVVCTEGAIVAPDLWYLASPYSKFYFGIESAAQMICKIAGKLIRSGESVFSPIAHSHIIAHVSGIDPLDHDFWMECDKAYMHHCTGLIVVMMPGWTKSKGMRMEIDAFKKAGKPIRWYDPETDLFVSEVLN